MRINEDIEDLFQHEGFRPFIAELEKLIDAYDEQVVSYDLGQGVDGLVHHKLRAEGARKLFNDVVRRINKHMTSKQGAMP